MKVLILTALLLVSAVGIGHSQSVSWRCSTQSSPWADKGSLETTVWDNDQSSCINVDRRVKFQQIEGWGGCFNELGWDALGALGDHARNAVIKSLFDPKDGCKFNICRMPIGSSDFALSYYSLDDTPGDTAMSHFSIARDRKMLIPYIKAAMVYQPQLKMWGSPWSPPSWMTTNGNYTGGSMKQTPENLAAYALYLEKAVQAYQKEGLRFFALDVQNEPVYNNNVYPQCKWTGPELRDFIKNYLGPRFRKDKVKSEIWLGTLPTSDWDGYPGTILSDPAALPYISGVSYQWGGRDIIQRTHDTYPQLDLMETEMECGDGHNTWGYGEYTFDLMRQYLNGWAGSFMQWNMVLDQTGKSSWGWSQNSMVSIDKTAKTVTYNPQFYAVKHFSNAVTPGSYRVLSTGNYADQIAFETPKHDLIVIVKNSKDAETAVAINLSGREIKPVLPAHSINTFVLAAK